jgi:4-amino-4-deoxy-L-arabinose transferase-like glycosyltransferase
MSFGIGTAWLIYCYLNNKLGRLAGLLGVFIFLSTPIVVRMSTVAYVDLGLTFFTTAAILAFIHWRDGAYKKNKWLFVSAIAMGLALGTKYNALIAWFFISLAVVFLYSRDTEKQWQAIRYGAIFFLVSLIVFSPWLIKNFILTGNPLYPLFNSFFQTGMGNLAADENARSMVSGDANMGMFKIREIMYGENFWETLLIPVRFFFQGQDYSDRYFDGILNPILIILVPFAFMKKSLYDHKLFFVLFSVFFILAAFFLDQIRIRYILPVVPILSIITAMGLINILNWRMSLSFRLRNVFAVVVLSVFIVVMSKNIFYIKNYYQSIAPMSYILGKESRDEFILHHDHSYAAMKYINKFTPEKTKIRLIFLAQSGYYLDRIYEDDPNFGMDVIRGLAAVSNDDKDFQKHLKSLGCTHFLVRTALFNEFMQNNYSPEVGKLLIQLLNKTTEMIYNKDGYAVYRVLPAS